MYLIRGAFFCNNLKNYFTHVLFVLVFSQVYINVRDLIFVILKYLHSTCLLN